MTGEPGARLAAVQAKFLARCREERAQLGPSWGLTENDIHRIGLAAHKIAGLAGTLGFISLGNAAAQVDHRIAKHEDWRPAYLMYVRELDNLLRDPS